MDRLIMSLLTLTLAWGVLAFGAVYEWAHQPLVVLAAIAGSLAWLRADSQRPPWTVIAFALLTMVAVSAQLVPLDAATIARTSPATYRILGDLDLNFAVAISSGAPVSHPLSLSPSRTTVGLLFFVTASIFAVGTAQWLNRTRLRHLAVTIAAIGTIIALLGIVQHATSPTLVYGFWQPEQQGARPFGPFVNKNHFAGCVLMVLPVTLGLAVGLARNARRRRVRDWRERLIRLSEPDSAGATTAVFAALLMIIALLLTLSRSGVTIAGIVVMLLATAALSKGSARFAVMLVGVAVAALAWIGTDVLAARFALLDSTSYEVRTGIWSDTWRMASDVPLFGVGIRAYTVASLFYQSGLPGWHVGAAHNDWLQLIAEGGLLVGAPAFLLLVALMVEIAHRFREHAAASDFGVTYWIRVGAATGLIAIAMQSLMDFSLQMPGNTVLFAGLWAIAIAPAPRLARARASRRDDQTPGRYPTIS